MSMAKTKKLTKANVNKGDGIDTSALNDAFMQFLTTEGNRLFLKNYDYNAYRCDELDKYDEIYTQMWAVYRDLKVVSEKDDLLELMWVSRKPRYAPTIIDTTMNEDGLYILFKFIEKVDDNDQPVWTNDKLLFTKESVEIFKKDYAYALEEINKRNTKGEC